MGNPETISTQKTGQGYHYKYRNQSKKPVTVCVRLVDWILN